MPDYSFYTETYKGNLIQEGDFERLALRAFSVVARYERIYTVTYPALDSRDMAACAIADELYRTQAATGAGATQGGGSVASVSIGSVSTSFNTVSAENVEASEDKRLYKAMGVYADIYRGASQC